MTLKSLCLKNELGDQARNQHIHIRDAFFGCETEGFKSHHRCNDNQQTIYHDAVSLYPTLNTLDGDAVGFSEYVGITLDDIKIYNDMWVNFIGI